MLWNLGIFCDSHCSTKPLLFWTFRTKIFSECCHLLFTRGLFRSALLYQNRKKNQFLKRGDNFLRKTKHLKSNFALNVSNIIADRLFDAPMSNIFAEKWLKMGEQCFPYFLTICSAEKVPIFPPIFKLFPHFFDLQKKDLEIWETTILYLNYLDLYRINPIQYQFVTKHCILFHVFLKERTLWHFVAKICQQLNTFFQILLPGGSMCLCGFSTEFLNRLPGNLLMQRETSITFGENSLIFAPQNFWSLLLKIFTSIGKWGEIPRVLICVPCLILC